MGVDAAEVVGVIEIVGVEVGVGVAGITLVEAEAVGEVEGEAVNVWLGVGVTVEVDECGLTGASAAQVKKRRSGSRSRAVSSQSW